MLDDVLLAAWMDGYYGSGNYRGRYWFVGMEEGGHGDPAAITRRLVDWDRVKRPELGYLVDDTQQPPHPFFREWPRLQRTWAALIRLTLALDGLEVTDTAVRMFQRDRLGRWESDNCLLELLPLPSPSTRHWIYGEHSRLPALRTRSGYLAHYAPRRAAHIRDRVREYAPEVVVCYSVNAWYWQWWQVIAGQPFERRRIDRWQFGLARTERTVFAVIAQPATMGITHEYFLEAGREIARLRRASHSHPGAAMP